GILIGAPVGLLAGITGIGGGIFLAPILHLRALAKTRTIAATACMFILVNSLAGLMGQLVKLGSNLDQSFDMLVSLLALPFAVLIGGLIGNRIALKYFNAMQLRRMTALLVFIVAIRLLVRFINY
ncbi:MAG: TSUP family transporter, partial [Gammaproteobacteria bacterium]|nr:TSUP family transporter [Gammaproteobacteria bacterium]